MLNSIVTFMLRNFLRHLSFSMITLSSLVIGITTVLLLFLWVKYEVTYDKRIVDHDRMFALLFNEEVEGEIYTEDGTSVPLMDFLSNEVPEVEAATRINNKNILMEFGEKSIHKTGVYGDSSFFVVHAPSKLQGNTTRPLADSRSVTISQTLAEELFGHEDALGKTILVDRTTEYMVSAVFAPYPKNSHFSYIHFVLPFTSQLADADDWVNYDIKLRDAYSQHMVEKKIDTHIATFHPEYKTKSLLFPVTDWRLRWGFENGKVSGGRIVYVLIFSISGLFVLAMACVNYVNISTARATKRMREIGVRKMTGATQSVLVRQFLIESFFITSLAAMLSLLLAYLLLPLFNQLVGIHLTISMTDPLLIIGLFCIVLITSFLAGIYPAWVLSSFRPAVALKSGLPSRLSGAGLRKVLVTFQFTLSVVIIFCALITWQQTDFLLKKDLGYDKHRIINVWLDDNLSPPFNELRERVLAHTAFESAAFGGASPMEVNGYAECNRAAAPFTEPMLFYGVNTDEHLLPMLNFKFLAGRNFSSHIASDSSNFIITQKAADLLGFENPIGQVITYNMYSQQKGEIIGVIQDFQHDDIHTSIKPVIFAYGQPTYLRNLFVRYQEGRHEEAISHLQKTFEALQPGIPLNYSFLDEDFENQLHREKLLSNISIAFTVIAICIACLGLLGLVHFNAQRRTKEIGIRKVLGATVNQVTVMLCRDFIPSVVYAFVLAFPLGYFIMQRFLQSYASRITISIFSFAFIAAFMLFLVLITALFQSRKAAQQNPVDSLKVE